MKGGYARPYLHVRLRMGNRQTAQVPMVVDTGADACFFDHELAYQIGLNPFDGRRIGSVEGLSEDVPTAAYPVRIYLSQLDLEFDVDGQFTVLKRGWNGLLGHAGFLDRFDRIIFHPGTRFELILRSER